MYHTQPNFLSYFKSGVGQRRVHSGTLHSTIHSRARSGVGLVHSTPLEVVDWELDWISDGVECSYPTPGQLLFSKIIARYICPSTLSNQYKKAEMIIQETNPVTLSSKSPYRNVFCHVIFVRRLLLL